MLLPVLLVLAAGPVKMASTDWASSGLDPAVAAALEGRFINLLAEGGQIHVTSSKDVAALLGLERQKQLLGCADDSTSCTAELAGALGVNAVLNANVVQIGKGYTVSLRVVSAIDGHAISTMSGRAASLDALQDWLDEAAAKMRQELVKALAPDAPVAGVDVKPAGRKSLAPLIPAFAGAAVGGAGVIVFLAREIPAGWLRDEVFDTPEAAAEARAKGEALERTGAIMMGVGAAAIAAGIIWFAVAKPEPVAVSVTPLPGGAALAISGALP